MESEETNALTREQINRLAMTACVWEPCDEVVKKEERDDQDPKEEEPVYMNFVNDEEGRTIYAQYTYEPNQPNHVVTIVEWDDTFPAANFLEDHQPPGSGAWIVKNSWDTDWGNDGYFYLFYYDIIKKKTNTGIACVEVNEAGGYNPIAQWHTCFGVKKYGGYGVPMDFAGAELVTGFMEMVVDALIKQLHLPIPSMPVMYDPINDCWSIKGYCIQ